MELCRLAAKRGDTDSVLEQPTGVPVVAVRACGGKRAERQAHVGVLEEGGDHGCQARMRDLRGEELEKPVELVGIAPKRRDELRRIGLRCCLERPHLHLQAPTEALDPAEHPHCVAL